MTIYAVALAVVPVTFETVAVAGINGAKGLGAVLQPAPSVVLAEAIVVSASLFAVIVVDPLARSAPVMT